MSKLNIFFLLLIFSKICFSQTPKDSSLNAWEVLKQKKFVYNIDTLSNDMFNVTIWDTVHHTGSTMIVFKNQQTTWRKLTNKLVYTAVFIKNPKTNIDESIETAILNINGDTIEHFPYNHYSDYFKGLRNNFFIYQKYNPSDDSRLNYLYDTNAKQINLPPNLDYEVYNDSLLSVTDFSKSKSNKIFTGLYYLNGSVLIPCEYEKIQLLTGGYFCGIKNYNLKIKSKVKINPSSHPNDVLVKADNDRKSDYISSESKDYYLIDSNGYVVPNSKKYISEVFDYNRYIEEEYKLYLNWVKKTLHKDLKIQYIFY